MEETKLENVDDYNHRRRKEKVEREAQAVRTGVACPKCGKELTWWRGVYSLAVVQFPPSSTRGAECKPCGLHIELET